jgi:hypothetical protein
MFRSLYSCQFGRQTSKVVAAEWFAAEFPEWSREAMQAVEWRRSDSAVVDLPGAQRTVELVRLVYDRTRTWAPAPRCSELPVGMAVASHWTCQVAEGGRRHWG